MQNKNPHSRSLRQTMSLGIVAAFVVCGVSAVAVGASLRASTGETIGTGSVIRTGTGWTATKSVLIEDVRAPIQTAGEASSAESDRSSEVGDQTSEVSSVDASLKTQASSDVSSDSSDQSSQQHRSAGAASLSNSDVSSAFLPSPPAATEGCCSVGGSSSESSESSESSYSSDSETSTNSNAVPLVAVLLETGSVAHPSNLNPHFFIAKNPQIADASSLSASLVARVTDASGAQLFMTPVVASASGGYIVTLVPPDQLTPGTYHIVLSLQQGSGIMQLLHLTAEPPVLFDGTVMLGGIVFNSDKDSYGINQVAHLSFSVLDDSGNPRCDMGVTVFVKDPLNELTTLTTESGGIATSHCDAQSGLSDYSFDLPLALTGDYLVHLEASDGTTTYSFRTDIAVGDASSALDVRRTLTSRMATNGMTQVTVTVYPHQTFVGSVTDVIPAGFDVQALDTTAVIDRAGNGHTITWNKLWQKDAAYALTYTLIGKSLPDHALISLLGPLKAEGNVQEDAGVVASSESSSEVASDQWSVASSAASSLKPQASSDASSDISSDTSSTDSSLQSQDSSETSLAESDSRSVISSEDASSMFSSSSAAPGDGCCSVEGSTSSSSSQGESLLSSASSSINPNPNPNPTPISSVFTHFLASLFADLTGGSGNDFSFTEAHRWQLLTMPLANLVPGEHSGPTKLQLTPTKDHFQATDAPTFLLVNSIVQGTGSALYTQNGDLKPDVAIGEIAKATTSDTAVAAQVVKAIIADHPSDIAQTVVHDSTDVTSLRDALGTQAGSTQRKDVLQNAVTDALTNTQATDALANVAVQDPAVSQVVGTLLKNDAAKDQIIQAAVTSQLSGTGTALAQTVSQLLTQASPDLPQTAATVVASALTQNPRAGDALAQAVTNQPQDTSLKTQETKFGSGAASLFKVMLKGKNGQTIAPKFHFEKGSVLLVLDPERAFQPGLYTLEVQTTDPLTGATQTLTQDFAWGVLAMNPTQDVYRTGDKAEIDIGVLDDNGAVICNAGLKLTVTNPDGTTQTLSSADNSIETTGSCGIKKAGFIEPDYKTFLTLTQPGRYNLSLAATTQNGTRTTSSTITVNDSTPYIITRTAATRLWPFAPSPMTVAVQFNQDFSGDITDQVPDGFAISDVSGGGIVTSNAALTDSSTGSIITWHGSWTKGETATFTYDYDAPDISPQYYLIGPLQLNDPNDVSSSGVENRSWQIANDNASSDNMILYWKFDETSAGTFTDSSGDGQTGTGGGSSGTNNTPQPSTSVPGSITFSDARSLTFDGTDDSVQSAKNSGISGNAAFTMAAWVKISSTATSECVMGFGDGNTALHAAGLYINTRGAGVVSGEFAGGNPAASAGTALSTGTWYHVALTKTAGAINTTTHVYVNGVDSGLAAGASTGTPNFTNDPIDAGKFANMTLSFGDYFTGSIDDVRVYNRALSATEIAQLAAGGDTSAKWTGSTSTDYETAGNWDISAVPDPYTNIIITNQTNEPVMSKNESGASLTIESGATLDLAGKGFTFNEGGALKGGGTLKLLGSESIKNMTNSGTGTVLYYGTGSTYTGLAAGNTYQNLTINDGLVGYWNFDSGTGAGLVKNLADNGFNGQRIGTGTVFSTNVPSMRFSDPRSMHFNGSNDHVDVNNIYSTIFNSNLVYTISMWINPSTLSNSPMIFDTKGTSKPLTNDTFMQLSSAGRVFWSSNNASRAFSASFIVSANTWTNLIFVKTGTGDSALLYFNGTPVTSYSGHLNNAALTSGNGITLGRYNALATNAFTGLMDDVRIYKRAISAPEAAAIANGYQDSGSGVYTLGSALTVNGNLHIISGGIDATSSNYNVTVGGNWSNHGAFTPHSDTVTLSGTNQTLSGSTVFYNLTKSGSTAASLFLDYRGRQSISGALVLHGAASNLLSIRSTGNGSGALIILDGSSGTQSLSYLDVKDSDASLGAQLTCYSSANGCVDSGNNTHWQFVPPTIYWNGEGADNNWSTAANWSGSVVPTSINAVVFDGAGKKNAVIDSGFAGTVASLTIASSYTGSITLSHALTVTGNLTDSGTSTTGLTWTAGQQNNLHVTGNMTVNSGATVTVAYSSLTGNGSGQSIKVDGNLTIAHGGKISADGEGFLSGSNSLSVLGPGGGWYQGASHGGRGGGTSVVYDSFTNPTGIGSSGSFETGGGSIILSVTGTLSVQGSLTANAAAPSASSSGAAGGTINITAGALSGSGVIAANGGVPTLSAYGAGGGGRISLANVTTDSFEGTLEVKGGVSDSWHDTDGHAGTIYFDAGHRSTLVIGGTGHIQSLRLGSDGTDDYSFGTVTVETGGVLEVDSNPDMNSGNGGAATLHVASLTVAAGGKIDADSLGFGYQAGPGKGLSNGAGASYGGQGSGAKDPYGSITNPINPGSGGGAAPGAGALIIVSTGSVVINGTVSASAFTNGTSYPGAGGTVNITATTMTGSGILSANSAAGLNSGGGGRIAAVLTSGTSFGNLQFQAYGGNGSGTKGAAGTIYKKTASQSAGDLIIDNNSIVATLKTKISSIVTGTSIGNVTMQNGGLLTLGTGVTLNVSGDWTANTAQNVGSGTVILDGTGQTITGTANTTFYNLTKTGSTTDTLTFNHLRTVTILHDTTLEGAANHLLSLRSDVSGSQFAADIGNTGTRTIQYLDVQDSDNTNAASVLCATGCHNSGNNTNWSFPWTGTLYQDDGVTRAGSGHTIAISVNGAAAAATTTTDASGAYSLIAAASSGDVITLYVPSGGSLEAAAVTKSGPGGGSVDLYKDHLITRSENGSPLTDANLATADNNGDSGITDLYTVTGNDLTVMSTKTLRVWTGSTLQPGGNIALKNIEIRGTLAAGTNSVNVDGSWDGSGGTLTGNSAVTFDATSAQTIQTNGSSFYDLTLNGTGGTFTMQDGLTVTHALALTAGTLNLNGHGLTTTSATYTNHGTLALHGDETLTGFTNPTTSGEVRYTGAGTYSDLDGLTSFHALGFSGAGVWTLHSGITTTGDVIITTGTLHENGQALSIGGGWNDTGTFSGTGTVTFTGSGTIREPARFQNVVVNNASKTVQLASPLSVSGSLTLTAGTLSAGTGYTLSLDGTWENKGATFSAGSGTVRLTGGSQTLSGSTTFWNLSKKATTLATLTFGAGKTQTVHGTWTAHGVSGNNLRLYSSTSGTQWNISPAHYDLQYINVADSDNVSGTTILASNDAVNGGNNTDWAFPLTVTVTDASGAVVGSGVTVALAVGSGVVVTSTTNSSGVATFNDGNASHTVSGVSSGALLTMYLPDSATGAVTVDHTNGTSLSFTLKQNTLTVSNHDTAPITNQDLITASEISSGTGVSALFTMSGTTLTDSGNLLIPTGSIYTPGGNVTANNYRIAGTFHMEANTVTVNGSWDATGGTFDGSNTVKFASSSAQTITVDSNSFYNVVFVVGSNGTGNTGTWTTVGNLRVLGTQSISNATRTTPPVITDVSASPIYDKTVLVTWTTDESADTEVHYGTASGSLNLSYTGAALDLSHTATLQSLTPGTTYYYRVQSEDLAGNVATGSILSFTTLAQLSTQDEVAQAEAVAKAEGVALGQSQQGGGGGGGGGGSSSFCAPSRGPNSFQISGINVVPADNGTASVTFTTNAFAVGIVSYGVKSTDESAASDLAFGTDHTITLRALEGHTLYQLQASAIDQCGNLVQSDAVTFTSGAGGSGSLVGSSTASGAQALAALLQKLSGVVSLSDLKSGLTQAQQAITNLAGAVPGPVLGGQPTVNVTDTTATIKWTTDEPADSVVSASPESAYSGSGYAFTAGNPAEQVTDHTVAMNGLTPGTRYHYRVSSATNYGAKSQSQDFTFVTNQQQIQVVNYKVDVQSPTTATFTWTTNVPTSSKVIYTPYRNGAPDSNAAQSTSSAAFSTTHSMTVKSLAGGVVYDVELSGADPSGVTVSKILTRFATSAQGIAPDITQVQTDSAIIPGKDARIQAVISWNTSTLTTGRVFYQQGVSSDPSKPLALSTPVDQNFTQKHVVLLSNLDPGAIYSFQVESTDLAGNLTRTKTYTILTPRQEQGIIQIILQQMQDTFGWLNNLKQ